MSAVKVAARAEPPPAAHVVTAHGYVPVGVVVGVGVTVGVVGVAVVGVAVVGATLGAAEALVAGEDDGLGVVANGLGDAMAAWTGSHDALPLCVVTGAVSRATAAVALPAVSAKRPQETAASRTPAADRATAVRRVRVKRI
jgi:hypothetical protein